MAARLRGKQVWQPFGRTPFSRSRVYDDIAAGRFPPGQKHGRIRSWSEEEIDAVNQAIEDGTYPDQEVVTAQARVAEAKSKASNRKIRAAKKQAAKLGRPRKVRVIEREGAPPGPQS